MSAEARTLDVTKHVSRRCVRGPGQLCVGWIFSCPGHVSPPDKAPLPDLTVPPAQSPLHPHFPLLPAQAPPEQAISQQTPEASMQVEKLGGEP